MENDEILERVFSAAAAVPTSWARSAPGEQLRALRLGRGISQRHLADESGVDQADISRLERGADARWETWRKLFKGLGFDAVLAPLPMCEEAEDLLREAAQRRKDRIEEGRMSRW